MKFNSFSYCPETEKKTPPALKFNTSASEYVDETQSVRLDFAAPKRGMF